MTSRYSYNMHSFLRHKDKIDLSNIPQSLKNTILTQAEHKLRAYESRQVVTRSDAKYTEVDTKQQIHSRKKRQQDIVETGFCSDPKELYRPLGVPIIDTEQLLYTALDIDTKDENEQSALEQMQLLDEEKKMLRKQADKERRKFREVPKSHSNGYRYIKEKMAKSNARINSVRFGIPFTQACEDDDREHTYDKVEQAKTESSQIDWEHIRIDLDREAYFKSLYNRFEASQRKEVVQEQQAQDKKPKSKKQEGQDPLYKPQYKVNLTPKQMEVALGIKAKNQSNVAERFFMTRHDFYEQQQRLSYLLHEELQRLDYERKHTISSKSNCFELHNKAQCFEDLQQMRQKHMHQQRQINHNILKQHPWYSELINKVVSINGVKREITHYENVLLLHLKGLIEDQLQFTKKVFVQFMKILPTKEFQKDEIQRIIRFVKQHETITERDFLEAVELAGHTI